jgi:uncharacterized protein (DUF1778 family)
MKPENRDKINWRIFSCNPSAIFILKKPENRDNINWYNLDNNPHPEAIKMIIEESNNKNLNINWMNLNEYLFEYISKPENINMINTINWSELSKNESSKAIEFLLRPENRDKIDWTLLSANSNPKAVELLLLPENRDKINWFQLSKNQNPKILELLSKPENKDKIKRTLITTNPNTEIVSYLLKEENLKTLEKHEWCYLSSNPNPLALELLSKPENKNKIDYYYLSQNPSIFELDYEAMKRNNQEFYEDLIKEVLKPSRVFKYTTENYDYLEELFF